RRCGVVGPPLAACGLAAHPLSSPSPHSPQGRIMKLTPHLVVNGASDASAYYVKAFGATEVMRMPAEDGKRLMHCELSIAGNKMFLCDNFPEYCSGKNRD